MSFYKQAAVALDHLDSKQGSVKGSLVAAGLNGNEKEGRRVLARESWIMANIPMVGWRMLIS